MGAELGDRPVPDRVISSPAFAGHETVESLAVLQQGVEDAGYQGVIDRVQVLSVKGAVLGRNLLLCNPPLPPLVVFRSACLKSRVSLCNIPFVSPARSWRAPNKQQSPRFLVSRPLWAAIGNSAVRPSEWAESVIAAEGFFRVQNLIDTPAQLLQLMMRVASANRRRHL